MGALRFLVGSTSAFWKLLAGIKGNLTDGFLRESNVIQQRCVLRARALCVCLGPARNTCKAQNKLSDLYGAVENSADHRSTNLCLSLFFVPPFLQEGADGYSTLIRISKQAFHTPLPTPPSARAHRGQAQ